MDPRSAATVPSRFQIDPRTYRARRGRMGVTRRAALDTLLERYRIPEGEGELDLPAIFGAGVPVVLEIGFGAGASTVSMAEADPATAVIAADVHVPGVAALLIALDRQGLGNVRVLMGDGRHLLRERIAPASLAGVRVYFPDPWPKAHHRRRRLVDAGFAALVADRLAPGGVLHCATDWEPYARQMTEVLSAEPGLVLSGQRERPAWRPVTRYEQRGLDQGHRVTDLIAHRPR